MHRLPSKHSIRRLRLAAILLSSGYLLCPVAACLLAQFFITDDRRIAETGIGLIVLTFVLVILQWCVATRANCPLCLTPVLATKGCAKHRQARSFLGSHRLRVALDILFRNSFRCPYCDESTTLRVRPRKRR